MSVQGGMLLRVLVNLRRPFFAHGQLNVTSSRSPEGYKTEFECTNVVVPQMLYRGLSEI